MWYSESEVKKTVTVISHERMSIMSTVAYDQKDSKNITLSIPKELHKTVKLAATENNMTISRYVREAIEAKLSLEYDKRS